MQYRKDCSPIETISRICFLLKKNKIKVRKKFFSLDGTFFSYHLELKDIKGIGANGKGFTKESALASAYAEFMERLQSRFLIRPYFLNKNPLEKIYPDEDLLSKENFLDLCKNFFTNNHFKNSLRHIDSENEVYRYAVTFYNYFEKRFELVPHRLINILTHSNGLCAGNSFEEALSHGICEIFERYVYKKIMLGTYVPSTFNLNNLKQLTSYALLDKIKNLGYEYELKDCSLNSNFPVVGVVIFNKEKDRSVFSVGSDPDFDIALQRCLTEICQGLKSASDLENKMSPILGKNDDIYTNWIHSYVANIGKTPEFLLASHKKTKTIPTCFSEVLTNKEALNFLLNILIVEKYSLYFKDLSYLSFPTYKVYIPGLSEIEDLDKMDLSGIENRRFLTTTLCNLPVTSLKDLHKSKKLIKQFSQNLFYMTLNLPASYFAMKGLVQTDVAKLDYHDLLDIIDKQIKGFKFKEKFPLCPNCKKCSVSCKFKIWDRYNTLLNNRYIGYLIRGNSSEEDLSIFIQELRSEMTQCRIIQIDKHLEDKKC